MRPYWIQKDDHFKLAIVPRPLGHDWLSDDIERLRTTGFDVLVSLLTPDEELELGLRDEGRECERAGISFVSFPITDRSVPDSQRETRMVVRKLLADLAAGKTVGIHCRACIGRSSLLAACVLCSCGIKPNDAFERIKKSRGLPVPETNEQACWVEQFALGLTPNPLE